MATILLAPFAGHGHINPTLKLARALGQRGHRVVYAGPLDCQELVTRRGGEFIPVLEEQLPKGSFDPFQASGFLGHVRQLRALTRRVDAALLAIAEGALDGVFERVRPDLVVCDTLLPYTALVAHGHGVPAVFFNTSVPREFIHPFLSRPPTEPSRRLRAHAVRALLGVMGALGIAPRMNERSARIARRYGYPVEALATEPERLLAPRLPELVLAPREFAEPDGYVESHYIYAGPSIDLDRAPMDFPWERLDADKPLILFSLGSQGAFRRALEQQVLDTVFAAARARPQWQFVFAVTPAHDPKPYDAEPNVVAVHSAPLLQLLERATAVVTHGGFNTVKECIYFGVPMVVVPFVFDMPGVGRAVEHRGLGFSCPAKTLKLEHLLASLDSLVNEPRWRTALAAMRACFHENERNNSAADALERLLQAPEAQGARLRPGSSAR
ncbi:hypothetical protein HUA78_29000 [Myxococcus sp. CA033]|uniref:nucleotide disphospho-sugar-binding domain-containing protein n=1 Tax=Myxococcus sp. CA033 TaxID=2741516 RepID=UPI00157A78E1|nr:nucleotide disphospho-sugar-binding domain-containing protein [Myxococcus sp. CA033]NTX38493.1 hypothetical protein [Myxococcus sp. CA033]